MKAEIPMTDYELGMFWAFILFTSDSIYRICLLKSKLNKNFKKVGIRLKWSTGLPTFMEFDELKPSKFFIAFKISMIFLGGIFCIFLSWVYVIYSLFFWVRNFYKNNFNIPETLKIARFKLRNFDMTFDEVLEQCYEADSFASSNIKKLKFNDYKKNHIDKMKLYGTEKLLEI